jgi:hypothetical protein
MENSEIETGKKLAKKQKVDGLEQFRVVVSKAANTALEDLVAKVNGDFVGGKVQKSDVANYVFMRLKNLLADSDIRAIQGECFDDKAALMTLGKSDKDVPDSVRKAIREVYGLSSRVQRSQNAKEGLP